ncbi:MAG: hypothetical protein IT557_18110 [Alphaproteobacteria bacterium]|nr:hypothetical protein [Alphaproteobacteria bacterium]
MSDEIFVDTVGEVVVTGGVVRIDLMAVDPSKRDAKNRPQHVLRQRIVMPADGFARLAIAMSGTLGQLEKMGLVKRRTGKAAEEAAGNA